MLNQLLFSLCLILSLAVFILYSYRQMLHYLHMLQLNSYRNERYTRWLHTEFKKNYNFLPTITLFCFLFATNLWLFMVLWGACLLGLFLFHKAKVQKKPLVITARVKRLISIMAAIFILLPLIGYLLSSNLLLTFLVLSFLLILLPYVTPIANFLAAPIEKSIAQSFVRKAKSTIQSFPNLKIIGITGSYGKTSSKYILQQLLSSHYHSLMTPESYNTLMGVTRVINENLRPTHNLFIVEMGAKQSGDIKEICDLVKPQISLITTVGEQHLETFKTLENIKNTKGEIVYDLASDGLAVLNGDNQPSLALKNTTSAKVIYFAIENKDADYTAENIQILSTGVTQFEIRKPDGQLLSLETRLLGQHNIYNILAAVSIAIELELDENKIKTAIRAIRPAPHRMNVKTTAAGVTIIDNAFSSNPSAARSSIEVMAKIQGQRKIIITPGMIELGEIEYEENKQFGANLPNGLDYIILVGNSRQTQAIQEGLKMVKFPIEMIYLAEDLNDANQHFRNMAENGDVVLYENDLPDNYI